MRSSLKASILLEGGGNLAQWARQGYQAVAGLKQGFLDLAFGVKKGAEEFKALAGAYTAFLVGRRALGMLGGFLKPAIEMQAAQIKLRTLTQANAKDMALFEKAAAKAAEETIYGPKEAYDALIRLRVAMGSSAAAANSLGSAMTMAMLSGGKMSAEEAASRLGAIGRVFSLTGKQAVAFGDQMYHMGNKMGVPIEDSTKVVGKLAEAWGKLGTEGRAPDQILQVGMLALRGTQNMQQAMTRLSRFADMLQRGKVISGLRQIGVNVDNINTGKIRDFRDILVDMAGRDPTILTKQISKLWDKNTQGVIISLMHQLRGGFRGANDEALKGQAVFDYLEKLKQASGGALAGARGEYMAGAGAQVTRLSEAMYRLAAAMGTSLLPWITKLTNALGSFVGKVEEFVKLEWVQSIGSIAGPIAMAVGAMLALKAGFWGLRGIISGAIRYIGEAQLFFRGLSKAQLAAKASAEAAAVAAGMNAKAVAAAGNVAAAAAVKVTWLGRAARIAGGLLKTAVPLGLAFLPEIIGLFKNGKMEQFITAEEELQRAKISAAELEAKLRVDSGKEALNHMQIGTQQFEEVIDKLAGIGKTRLQVVDAQPLANVQSWLRTVQPKNVEEERAKAGALSQIAMFRDLAKKGGLNDPRMNFLLQGAVASALTAADYLMVNRLGGGMSEKRRDKLLGGVEKKVIKPLRTAGMKPYGDKVRTLQTMIGGAPVAPGQASINMPGFSKRAGQFFTPERALALDMGQRMEQVLGSARAMDILSKTPAEGGTAGLPPSGDVAREKELASFGSQVAVNAAAVLRDSVEAALTAQRAAREVTDLTTANRALEAATRDGARDTRELANRVRELSSKLGVEEGWKPIGGAQDVPGGTFSERTYRPGYGPGSGGGGGRLSGF